MLINVGAWTEVKDYNNSLTLNRKIERKVKELSGRKTLYAHTYYTEDEFWSIYNEKSYNEIRSKFYADIVFPDIYSKVVVKERYEPSISNAVKRLIFQKLPIS